MLAAYVIAGTITSYIVLFYEPFGTDRWTRALGNFPGTFPNERTSAWVLLAMFVSLVCAMWPIILLAHVVTRVRDRFTKSA